MEDFKNRDKIENCKAILKKIALKRSSQEVAEVVNLISELKFFKERKIQTEDLEDITKVLTFERKQAGDIIINYGEKGDKFYIIV